MKINQEKFPALFDRDMVLNLYRLKADPKILVLFESIIDVAKTNLTYIARPIMTPMLESYDKLLPHRRELQESCRGLMFVSKLGHPHLLMYSMLIDQEKDKLNIMCQVSCGDGKRHWGSLFAVNLDREKNDSPAFRSYNSVPPISSIEVHDNIVSESLRAILAAELFINFAEVETKTMTPNTQIWDERGVSAIYNNKTPNSITVIDSTWYTNLVSSGAFKVRGHFRLQPYGPNRSMKRLQWISDFEKSGYTRKAKIENEANKIS
jgi:hypothetical protein